MVCSRQSIGWGGLWRSCCPSCQIFGAVRFEPKRSFLDSPRERRCSCAVDFWHIVVKPRRRKTTRTHYRFWKSRWNNEPVCDASGLGGFVRRYLSTRSLRITSNFFRCTMYLASHSVLCHCLVKQHSRNDKKKKKKKKKDCQMSVYHKADPGELIQWVTPESRSSAASNSGLIRIGTQPRTADAWHHDSCRPRGVVTRDFSAIFDRLFDRLPVRISTSDLHHWILRKKIFHIRAYDFGVQFSFKRRFFGSCRVGVDEGLGSRICTLVPIHWQRPTVVAALVHSYSSASGSEIKLAPDATGKVCIAMHEMTSEKAICTDSRRWSLWTSLVWWHQTSSVLCASRSRLIDLPNEFTSATVVVPQAVLLRPEQFLFRHRPLC